MAFSLLAAAGIASSKIWPGDVAYWIGPPPLLPLIYVAALEFEDRRRSAGRVAKALVRGADRDGNPPGDGFGSAPLGPP